MDILDILLDILLKPPQPLWGYFNPFFSFPFYPCHHIFTKSEQVTRVFIFFVINNDPIHRKLILFL